MERLNLSGNWIEGLGGAHMAAMLSENDFISHLVSKRVNKLTNRRIMHLYQILKKVMIA